MKKSFLVFLAKIFLVLSFCFPASSWALSLPAPGTLLTGSGVPLALKYGDFTSYSLALLALDYDLKNGGGTGPGNPYYVNSTPGAIKDGIVLYTGSGGTGVLDNPLGMDDAYETPSGKTDPFNTTDSGDPTPDLGDWDEDSSWDTSIASLKNYLAGGDLIFYFNHNELGGTTEDPYDIDEQDLIGWGEVRVVNEDGVQIGEALKFWDSEDYHPDELFEGTDEEKALWVQTHGSVETPYGVVNHNLGANQAAYAFSSEWLNTFLAGWTDDSPAYALQVEFHLDELSNGYEQLFIVRDPVNTLIPEPATLTLLGCGLLALAGIGRRRIN